MLAPAHRFGIVGGGIGTVETTGCVVVVDGADTVVTVVDVDRVAVGSVIPARDITPHPARSSEATAVAASCRCVIIMVPTPKDS